jgi:hypothetical protein
VYKV